MQNETPEIAPATRVRRVRYIFSDFHLGQGRRPDGTWHPMEDFRSDREFALMLRHLHESYPLDVQLELHGNGDVFDFMATPFEDKFRAVPTVEASLAEIKTIYEGHREFFEALRWFLEVRLD